MVGDESSNGDGWWWLMTLLLGASSKAKNNGDTMTVNDGTLRMFKSDKSEGIIAPIIRNIE